MSDSRPFARRLRGLIDDRYQSLRAFVRIAEPTRNEDTAVAYLSKVLKGSKPPPLERIDAWATALGLAGDEAEDFRIAAHLEHATPLICGLVQDPGTLRRAAERNRRYRG